MEHAQLSPVETALIQTINQEEFAGFSFVNNDFGSFNWWARAKLWARGVAEIVHVWKILRGAYCARVITVRGATTSLVLTEE